MNFTFTFTPMSIVVTGIILVVIAWFVLNRKVENFSSKLDHPTKCFDCENQYPAQCAWKGQKSKCYSCEKQALSLSGGNPCSVFDEHPIKYYQADPIPGMGYPKMGYMG
jgi:hypothetical protein